MLINDSNTVITRSQELSRAPSELSKKSNSIRMKISKFQERYNKFRLNKPKPLDSTDLAGIVNFQNLDIYTKVNNQHSDYNIFPKRTRNVKLSAPGQNPSLKSQESTSLHERVLNYRSKLQAEQNMRLPALIQSNTSPTKQKFNLIIDNLNKRRNLVRQSHQIKSTSSKNGITPILFSQHLSSKECYTGLGTPSGAHALIHRDSQPVV